MSELSLFCLNSTTNWSFKTRPSEVDETDIKALKELIQELILKYDIKNAISYLKEGIDSQPILSRGKMIFCT